MRRVRDPLARHNGSMKLLANFFNAIGLGLIGFAVLGPVTTGLVLAGWAALAWGVIGLAMHAAAHYILRYMEKETDE